VHVFVAAFGSAATRLENVVASGTPSIAVILTSSVSSGEQAAERDRAKRELLLHRMQQLIYDGALFAPIFDVAFLSVVGPRVEESGLGLIRAGNSQRPTKMSS